MMYNGTNVKTFNADEWDGKPRHMLVKYGAEIDEVPVIRLVIGFHPGNHCPIVLVPPGPTDFEPRYETAALAAEIPKPRLMTKKELAEWLQDGKGCYRYGKRGTQQWQKTYYILHPTVDDENEPVSDSARVRVRGTNDWVKPTIDLLK